VADVAAAAPAGTATLSMRWPRPGRVIAWTLLFVGGVLMITPIIFMLSTSLKDQSQVYDLRLIPAEPTLANYVEVLADGRFLHWFINSLIVATTVCLSNVFFDSLVGYTLAKFRFRGR
jgi:multiple sugar transport system permease protein